jgi:hypothetical protein
MDDEFKKRFNAAKTHRRSHIDDDGREVYKFCFNGRESEWDNVQRRDDVPEEIFSDFPATVAEDFAGELFSTMTPENTPWVEYEAGEGFDSEEEREALVSELGQFENIMAKSVRSSNYYDEGYTAFQDATIGNVAIWADRPTLNSGIVCEAIPLPELFLRLGPMGIDDRFRRRKYAYGDLTSLFPDANWPKKLSTKFKSKGFATVIWGYWQDFKDPENPTWVQRIRVEDEQIGLDMDLEGIGSCPIVVGRFNPRSGSAWGYGPGRRMLPTLRLLDELTRMNIEGMDRNLDPAYTYAHDGMLDLSGGIESGLGYPAMPGSAESIKAIGTVENLDYGFFSEDRLHEDIRNGFYREMEQRGKTPPSASQYMGQEQKQLRRIARPGTKLWSEFGIGLLKRFEYLERQAGGMMENVKTPLLDSGKIVVRPISPLERSQAREDVLMSQNIMAMAMEALGPQQAPLVIDGVETMTNIKAKLKDKLVAFRTEEKIQQIMQAAQPQQQDPNAQPQE